MNDEELYVHRDSVTSYADINRELARYFSCTGGAQSQTPPDTVLQQSSRCMRQLKFVLLLLTRYSIVVIIADGLHSQGYLGGSPTAVQACRLCPLWEPSASHPIVLFVCVSVYCIAAVFCVVCFFQVFFTFVAFFPSVL